jgi:hypothetical protein
MGRACGSPLTNHTHAWVSSRCVTGSGIRFPLFVQAAHNIALDAGLLR